MPGIVRSQRPSPAPVRTLRRSGLGQRSHGNHVGSARRDRCQWQGASMAAAGRDVAFAFCRGGDSMVASPVTDVPRSPDLALSTSSRRIALNRYIRRASSDRSPAVDATGAGSGGGKFPESGAVRPRRLLDDRDAPHKRAAMCEWAGQVRLETGQEADGRGSAPQGVVA